MKIKCEKKKFLIQYSVIFLIISLSLTSIFWFNGKSLIWKLDGEPVLVPEFYYLGHYIRRALINFVHGEWSVPLYDFSLGLGKNIFEYSANWYLEPISFLSIFAKYDYVEYVYEICTFVRLFLVGISFSTLCFRKKCEYMPTLIGSIIYTFSFYTLYIGFRFPLFLTPMIYFPIFIIAIDLILEKNDIRLLTIMVFLSAWTHYYFLFISTIFLGFYFIVEYIWKYKQSLKQFFCKIGLVILTYILGCCMASLLLYQNVVTFLKSNRTGAIINTPSLLHYEKQYYERLWKFISFPTERYEIGYELFIAFIPLVLFSFIVLFMNRRKEDRDLKTFFFLFLIMVTIPAASFFVCGLSNINNRWAYVLVIFFHFVLVYCLPSLFNLNRKKMIVLLIYPMVYAISLFCGENSEKQEYISLFFIVLTYVVIVLVAVLKKKQCYILIFAISIINVVFMDYTFIKNYGYIYEYVDKGMVETNIKDVTDYFYGKGDGDTFYRVENLETARTRLGSSVCREYNSVSDYSNVMNKDLFAMLSECENSGLQENIMFYDMDGRTILDQINAVKYVCVRQNQNSYVPYGYSKIDEVIDVNGEIYEIYQNDNPTSIGYTVSNIMSSKAYDELSPVKKQSALIETAVVEEEHIVDDMPRYNKSFIKDSEATISKIWIENGEMDNNKITVYENGATIHVQYNGMPNSEVYLRLRNVDISNIGLYDTTWSIMNSFGQSKTVFFMSDNNYYNPRFDNKIINLGYSTKGQGECSIYIPVPGEYDWSGLEILTVSMDSYEEIVSSENREYVEDISVYNNLVTGKIVAPKDSFLCLSIIYDKNWELYIDGEKADLIKANRTYMGAYISKGKHDIVLKYKIEHFKLFAVMSGVSILTYILICVHMIKKNKEK